MKSPKYIYYIDYLKIYCPRKTNKQLEKSLPLSKWRSHADKIDFAPLQKWQNYNRHFKSCILEIVRPSNKLLQMLATNELLFGKYHICYMEIALDIFARSEAHAEKMLNRIAKTLTRRYVSVHLPFDRSNLKYEKKKSPEQSERFFSDIAYYWGLRKNPTYFASYAAYSKAYLPELRPAVHLEWRIRHSSEISEKAGVDEFRDLLALDLKNTFSSLLQRFMRFYTINHEKHGRFILNAKPRVKIDPVKAVQASQEFCSVHGIESYARLRHFYKHEQERIAHKIGNWSSWERRVRHMSDHYLRSFADETDAPNILDSIYSDLTV